MSDFIETLEDVKQSVSNNINDILCQLSVDCSNDVEMICNEIQTKLDDNGMHAPDVVYYAEAWGIVAGSAFNDFDPDIDFSACKSSLDCVMLEANEIINEAYYEVAGECIQEAAESIYEVIETVLEIGGDESIDLNITSGSCHGWAVHNRETESGIAIYDDEPGHYNAEKLEGELYAVEGSVNGSYVSACWNPDDY